MGICASCDGTTNKDDGQKELHCNEEEEGEEDKLDQGEEEDSQDALVRQDQQVHHHDQEILHHDQQVHRHDHHYFHQQARGRKSMCRKCNLRLLTLIHVPPKEDTAVEEKRKEQEERNLGSTTHSSVEGLEMSSRVDGDTSDKMEDAGMDNSELRKSRKPHRDLHVSWRKGHGDFIDHLMFGWHH